MPVPATVRCIAEAEREAKEAESDRVFASSILKRDINWSGYEKNGFLTKKELGLILDYDKQRKEDQSDLLAEKGADYAALFVKALESIRTKDSVEYLIVLVDALLETDPSRVRYFQQLTEGKVDPYASFLRILQSTEQGYHPFVLGRTSTILATLLSTAPQSPLTAQSTTAFMRYLVSKLASATTTSRDVLSALLALKPLLRQSAMQELFASEGGIRALAALLSKDSVVNAQLLYSVGFVFWLLSYSPTLSEQLMDSGGIKRVVGFLKTQSMEKVIRISVATLRNLLSHNNPAINEALIGLSLLPIIDTLNKRKFKDQDINPDMEEILAALNATIARLSTFDMYHSEVISGNLQWTPAHRNEVFWRENIGRFEEKNYQLVAKLIDLLADEDDVVREVACHDLGEFARFAPEGKRVIGKLGGKAKLMVNLSHKNPKVSKAALLATQKLMVANWEHLAKASGGGVAALVSKSAQKA